MRWCRRLPGVLAATFASISVLAATRTTQELEDFWPHAPGASWSYDRVELQWGTAAKSAATTVRFTLGDTTSVGGSITVHPLIVDVSSAVIEAGTAFWWQLAIARPGLSSLSAARPTSEASSGLVIHDATLLRVAADEIAAYRDSPAIRSWLYAEPDLTPGHTFRLQLIPDLADSVFLDGSVVGSTDVTTPAGSFTAALQVRYEVDYGWAEATDSLGAIVGRTRARTRGKMYYAPGVGPVLARETFVPVVESQGSPPPPLVDSTFAELRLVSYSLTPTTVGTRSWTEMKTQYR
jgi:hypothetical protein